jgi:ankyrin repeat protein
MYASAANLADCLPLLCLAKSDVNRTDSLGNSALHYAYAFGSIAAASVLEEKGADPSCENHNEKTPLALAGISSAVPKISS